MEKRLSNGLAENSELFLSLLRLALSDSLSMEKLMRVSSIPTGTNKVSYAIGQSGAELHESGSGISITTHSSSWEFIK